MSGFSAEWLALRATADTRARAAELETALAAALAARSPRAAGGARGASPDPERTLQCVDLASGTGANAWRLAPALRGPQHWRLLDADPALLALARARCAGLRAACGTPVQVEAATCDLAQTSLDEACSGAALVTASALLDLVSAAWLDRLADAVVAAGAVALFVLDYDGRRECSPPCAADAHAHAAFDRHQRRCKSFGPALGPAAAAHAAQAFAARGYRVVRARSDWELGPEDAELQRALLHGWAEAAIDAEPQSREWLGRWLACRLDYVATGASHLRVGHEDLLATPP